MIKLHFNLSYSIFIRIAKFSLVGISFALILLTLFNNKSFDNNKIFASNYKLSDEFMNSSHVLVSPSFIGIDKKKNPYKVSASKASKKNNNENIFDLIYPQGELKSEDSNFYLEGKKGIFNKPEKILKLFEEVKFTDKEMFLFNTAEAIIDFKKKTITGNKKISGAKHNSTITSEGFYIEQKTNKILFKGKSTLVLNKEYN